jgi:hypothetical protein
MRDIRPHSQLPRECQRLTDGTDTLCAASFLRGQQGAAAAQRGDQ